MINYKEFIFENKYWYQGMNYGDIFVPIRIYQDLLENSVSTIMDRMDAYEKTLQHLMNGKYAKFSIYDGGFVEGYVDSVKLIRGMGNFLVKMKGLFGKKYTLDAFNEVQVYKTKPKSILSESDPYGEEEWDD